MGSIIKISHSHSGKQERQQSLRRETLRIRSPEVSAELLRYGFCSSWLLESTSLARTEASSVSYCYTLQPSSSFCKYLQIYFVGKKVLSLPQLQNKSQELAGWLTDNCILNINLGLTAGTRLADFELSAECRDHHRKLLESQQQTQQE
jgi:hypothetical protein